MFGATGKIILVGNTNDNPTKLITEGSAGDLVAGYNGANTFYTFVGSIDNAEWNGGTIVGAYYETPIFNVFALLFNGNVAADIFTSVTPQDGSTHLSATPFTQGFNSGDNFTFWTWLEVNPARWNGTGSSTIILT